MTEKHKQVFRRMNLDADVRSLQPGEYRKLLNGIPIAGTTSTGAIGLNDAIASIYGNAAVTNSDLESDSKVVGFVEDRVGNRAFFAVFQDPNDTIYKVVSTPNGGGGPPTIEVSVVMRTSVFNFASTDFVDMDVIGDILIITNGSGEIKKIDIGKAEAGDYGTVTEEKITLIKRPPQLPVTWALGYDLDTLPTNNMAGNYFQFYWRYIYENYDYSVFSPASKVTNSFLHPTTTHCRFATNANVGLTGIGAVSGVDTDGITTIAADDRVLVMAQTNPVENGIYLAKAGAWVRTSDFDTGNDEDIIIYVIYGLRYNFNSVFRVRCANIGTDDTVVERIDGPNYATITRPETPPAMVISVEYAVRVNGSNELFVYLKEDTSFSSSHTFYNDTYLFTVPDSETTIWSDSVPLTCRSLKIFKSRLFTLNNTEGYDHETTTQISLSLSTTNPPVSGGTFQAARTYNAAKRGGTYNVGVVFFDFARRHSGVKLTQTIDIPFEAVGSSTVPVRYKIRAQLSGSNSADVPAWATHYCIVVTKNITSSFFLQQRTTDIFHYKKDSAGDFVFGKDLASFTAEGTAIDIDGLTKSGIGYTFQSGDRLRIFRTPTEIIDVLILGQDGRFLLTRTLTELTLTTTTSDHYDYEIYTPKQAAEPFYETGEVFAIANFTSTDVTIEGDIEVVNGIFYTRTSTYSATDPYSNSYYPSGTTLQSFERMNAWANNFDKWVTRSGRTLIVSPSVEVDKSNYLRFSQPYVQGASYFGLNNFNAIDDYPLPIDSGPGVLLAEAGDVLVVVHEIETTAIYVGEGFISTGNGTNFLAKTEGVIGDDRRYLGGHGTIHPESIVSRDGRVYFYDQRKGCIVRRSQDGLTRISDYGIKSYVTYLSQIHDRVQDLNLVTAGWDPQYECYCITFNLPDLVTTINETLMFHEKTNSWVCFSSLIPFRWGTLGQVQLTFQSTAALWYQTPDTNYNKFFNIQNSRELETEIAPLESLMKILQSIEIDQENIYVTAGTNEEIVAVYLERNGTKQTNINYLDFVQREGVWRSAFFNNINDAQYSSFVESKFKSSYKVRGQSFYLTLVYNGTDKNILRSISTFFRPKMQSST